MKMGMVPPHLVGNVNIIYRGIIVDMTPGSQKASHKEKTYLAVEAESRENDRRTRHTEYNGGIYGGN